MYLIAHLSDPHLDGTERSRTRLQRVAAYLHGLSTPPDAIVVTGDIIQGDATADYRVIADALDGLAPVLYCPGNSDQRGPFAATLLPEYASAQAADEVEHAPVNYHREVGRVTFVMLDASVPGHYHGQLGDVTAAWLADTLAAIPAARPVVIGLHQPPLALGHPIIDSLKLLDPEPLAAALARHPNVVAMLVGHTHAATVTTFAGRPLIVSPGIHSNLHFPWEPSTPGRMPIDEAAPPALASHLLDDDNRVTTYFRTLS